MASPSSKFLLEQIAASEKREKKFRKAGRDCNDIYEAEDLDKVPFNILYSNTETLLPALYNATPRPVVTRRFKDKDPLAAAAASLGKRTLEYQLDNGLQEQGTFDDMMKSTVLASLVPGRGIARFQYKADIEKDEAGAPKAVKSEYVCTKIWPWDQFCMGYAQKWVDVPWIAYQHSMTRGDLEQNFGKAKADTIEVKQTTCADDEKDSANPEDKLSDAEALTPVYEVWYKATRKIYWVSPHNSELMLKTDADPYDLNGFFDCQEPLRLFQRLKSLIPRQLYRFYENQAKELNSLTLRLQSIAKQIKMRGVYDSSMGEDLKKIFDEDLDGAMVPVSNPAIMQMGGTLDKSIWTVPIDKLIQVAIQLQQQRQSVKQTIYEITGISDILRGSSVASETATAQEIKNQWGTLRLKKMQKQVSYFARDGLRIMLELSMTKLSEETLKKITGLPFPLSAEKQEAQAQVKMLQEGQALGAQMPPMPPEIQQMAQMPSIGELQKILADDKQRSYSVDIETNSTVDAEATEDKQDIAELLNAIAQFMSGVAPMIQSGTMPFEVAKTMLMTIVRRYNFGPELEAALEQMKAPAGPNPEQAKQQQAEMQKQQQALQQEQQKLQQEKMSLDMERKEFALEKQFAAKEIQMLKQFADKEQQLKLQAGIQTAEHKISSLVESARSEGEKISAAAETSNKAIEGGQQVQQAVGEVTKQFGEMMQAFVSAMDTMAKAQSAPRQITDSKGRTMTVTPMTGA